MQTFLADAVGNFLSPMVLFFVLGFFAAVVRSDLEFPEVLGKSLALYLMVAIGFKGGVELSARPLTWEIVLALLAAVVLSFLMPVVAFGLLRLATRLKRVDAAAVAAHYGSISVVTFVTAAAYLTDRAISYEGELVAMAALMETPAIITGLLLAGRSSGAAEFTPQIVRKVLASGSILLLLGSFLIGWTTGPSGMEIVAPFFGAPFMGILCLFLLEMGLLAGRRIGAFRTVGLGVALFGIYMPLVGAALGLGVAWMIGFSLGGATLLAVLSASASYIVVPAAMRMAVPEANPAYYITLALAISFPFNIVIGIPLYFTAAQWLWSG